jgi:hypothetical protein
VTGTCSEKAEGCEGKMLLIQLINLDWKKAGSHSTADFVNNYMTIDLLRQTSKR